MRAAVYLLFMTLIILAGCKGVKEEKIIGIKIYDYEGSYDSLADAWQGIGINTAYVSASLGKDIKFRNALRTRGVNMYIIFPVFQNPDAIRNDSTLAAVTSMGTKAMDEWVEFVCPSRTSYRRAKIEELAGLVRTADPYGISLDFIRQFVFWEMIYPGRDPALIDRACYCDSCIGGFLSENNLFIPYSMRSVIRKAEWIDLNCRAEWNSYRCRLITSMVRDLAEAAKREKNDIKINLHAVPWRAGDFGNAIIEVASQDITQLSQYVDYISPMCYSQMVKQDAAWISGVTVEMDKSAPGKILPSIQVSGFYNDMPFTNRDFGESIDKALEDPSCGVVFFSWPLFASDSSRIDVARAILGRK